MFTDGLLWWSLVHGIGTPLRGFLVDNNLKACQEFNLRHICVFLWWALSALLGKNVPIKFDNLHKHCVAVEKINTPNLASVLNFQGMRMEKQWFTFNMCRSMCCLFGKKVHSCCRRYVLLSNGETFNFLAYISSHFFVGNLFMITIRIINLQVVSMNSALIVLYIFVPQTGVQL